MKAATMVNGNKSPVTEHEDKDVEASTSKDDVAIKIEDGAESIMTELHLYRRRQKSPLRRLFRMFDLRRGTIPRIPERLRQVDNDAYEPRIISIGPYHRGKPMLRSMEEHKLHCLDAIVKRNSKFFLIDYIREIEESEMKARRYYENIKLESKAFVKMMLLDGCFIVGYLLKVFEGAALDIEQWMKPLIHNDLLLLENQLPFFIVESIYCKATGGNRTSLLKLVQNFCADIWSIQRDRSLERLQNHYSIHHFLHLYYICLSYDNVACSHPTTPSNQRILTIPSATFLDEAGIKIKMQTESETNRVIDVKYQNGIIEIKPLFLDAFTISIFRNLIAFEKFNPYMASSFTAFAKFMDYIIDTSKDVSLLRKKGIIKHAFGSDEEVANIFNQLTSKTVGYLPSELADIYQNVDDYCNTKCNYWWASLQQDYFGTPWAVISLVAAGILLLLTFIQSFFAMYSYFKPPSSS